MDEKQLEELKAEGQFAINDPEAYVLSNPTPHDWTMSAQEIARSVKINPLQLGFTKEEIEGPRKLNAVETFGKGVWSGIAQGVDDFDSMMNVRDIEYSSPNMTEAEATRLMQDALYTRHKGREAEQELTAQKIKYNTLYDISNAVGSLIKYAGLGLLTGSPATVGAVAGLESMASMEANMVDSYVDQTGGIEGYDKKRRDIDIGIAGSYGVFTGITESLLGVDRIAAGALGRYSKLDAASRLARIQGKLTKSGLLQATKRFGMSAIEEGTEEFIQSVGEDVANYIAGYEDAVFTDENFKKAITSAAYGAMLGGPAGWFLYRYNRKSVIDKINKMSQERNWGLTDQQIAEATDQILEESKTTMVDEIATRAEIKNHYGQAYELVKQRITEQIDATGTTPWTDENKSKEEYITTLADSITIPAINVANTLNIPLSEFLEIADINTATIAGNIAWLRPITSVEDIDKIIADQDAIIKEQREAKKLGIDNEITLNRAKSRKAIAERVRKQVIGEQALRTIRQNRKKETADYVTAQDLQPEQVKTLENAVQATGDQDYVLFGGIRIPVEYQVVELATIQPSHIDGTPNPAYSNVELQNRASRGTTQDVADLREKATNITPERLMRASTSAEGAPVVNEKGEVIAGNGREEIIRYAYENPETAEKYKQELVKQGFNIEGMQQPILVRRNTTMTDQEQIAAADISNISETSAFDNASQARRDTQYLKDSKTPIEFASKLPMSERRGLMQNNGKWNKRKAQQRYEDALLAWLCGNDTQLFENLVLDRGLSQKVIDILATNGTLIYETATKYPDTELREDIYHALVKMQRATRDNFLETTQQLELDGHDVMPENIIIWNWLFTDTTTNRQFLQSYATTLANNHESVNTGEDMFGQKVAPLSKKDALMQALKKADQAKAETMAARGREYAPLFDENGMVTDVNLAAAIASYNNQFAPTSNLNQTGYASMRGELVGEYIDANLFAHSGEGPNVHGWGNYFLASKDIDKRRYFEKFNREGPNVRYNGKEVTRYLLANELKLNNREVQDLIINRLTDITIPKQWFIDAIEKIIDRERVPYKDHIENVVYKYSETGWNFDKKHVREIIDDIEKIVMGRGATTDDIAFPFAEGSEEANIQDKYRDADGRLSEDFMEVWRGLIKEFGGDDTMTARYPTVYQRTVADIIALRQDLETIKNLDFDKFTGRTGMTYKGKDFFDWFVGRLREEENNLNDGYVDVLYMQGTRSMIIRNIENILRKGGNIIDAVNKFEKENVKPWLDIKPEVKQYIKDGIAKEKTNYPDADAKAVQKFLFEFMDKFVEDKWPSDGMVYQKWYTEEASDADKKLIDAVTGEEDHGIKYPGQNKDDKEIIIGLINKIRDAESNYRVSKLARKILKDTKKSDFVYKPNASMYKTDQIPENDELLDLSKKLNKQPKLVQEGLLRMIEENRQAMPFLNQFLEYQALQSWDVLDALFNVGDKQGMWDLGLMRDIAFNMMKSEPFKKDSAVRDAIDDMGSRAIRYATSQATQEGRPATVKDLISALNEVAESMLPKANGKVAFNGEENDIYQLRDILIKRVSKHGLDTKLEDITDDIRPVEFANIKGDYLFRQIDNYLSLFNDAVRILRNDPIINAPNAGSSELTSKLLLKYGIRGVRYWGSTDKRGFVTFEPTKPTELLYSKDLSKNLVATHAIKKQGMKEALRLGGFAMPSLAIQQDIDNSYGEIIFVAPASMAQPSKETRVYDRDAWTPMINFIEYERKPGFYEEVERILEKGGADPKRASTYVMNIETSAKEGVPTWNVMAEELFGIYKGYDVSEVDMRHEISNNGSLEKEYEEWYYDFIIPNLKARIFRGFTEMGNRRYADVTLDNLVRELKTQPEHRDMTSDMYFFHDVMRELVTRFKTTSDLKKQQGRLLDRNEVDAKVNELNSEYNALATELRTDESNHIPEIALAEALIEKTGPMADRLEAVGLKHDAKSVKQVNDLVKKIKQVPVKYFEGKVRRAVKFNEFSGVFVPESESYNEIANQLQEQGANVIRYGSSYDLDAKFNELTQQNEDILFQKRGRVRGTYDPDLPAIMLTKYWNETTLVHEYHHRYLEKLWGYFKQAQTGERAVSDEFLADMDKLFQMLEIDPEQDQLTVVQQEKFATMVEAYLTGLGVDNPENLAFQSFLHWIPEQYKSIMDLGYLDENNEIQNPILDQESIDWFNKWFACPFAPSLPSAPDAQRIINPTDKTGKIVPSSQKIMNNREKEWGQDSEEQNKADAQLWRAINENTPNDMRAALDGEKVNMKAVTNNLPDDTKLPEPHKPTLRDKWFKTYQPDARERAADMAREYLAQNPEHARELAFADPETMAEFDAPVDHGMLIRAVMETVPHGSDEWYILNDNLATVKSMSGSTLSLSGDLSHQAYLDAKREVEAARELKAAVNYAGTRRGAMDKWNSDIRAFIAQRTESLLATEPDSEERKTAIKAFLEEAKTKFSANTTDSVLNQLDLTGIKTKNSQVFIKWAEKQIKQAAHAKIDANEQKELIKASIAAQLAIKEIDSTVQKDGKYTRAVQSAKDIRHWQFVKDKMKKAYIGRWGKFGIFWDNLFGSYAPSAMLMSANTLFFANVPSTALNTGTIRLAAKTIGKNNVDEATQKGEIERIKQIFNASGVNLAQMEKPTSPSTLHGEKYTKSEQSHWYDFTFEILGRTDNIFRIPTFVDALARIATKNAGGDKTKATVLFKEYAKLNNQSDEAKIARKQALAVANMAVFTQDGTLATGLNQIRTVLNTISRVPLGLDPQGFGLGNILAPFLKTGANITEMGFDAMLAPIRTLATGLQKLQGKEIPDIKKLAITSDWINLAWTSVMIALMAAISSDDDEWYTEPYTSGRRYDPDKPYDSIKIGGIWVKMDIFGPVAIPLRTAAMTIKDWEDKKLASIGDGMFEALSDTPLVQQFTDSSLDYMSKQPEKYWSSFGYNQANKLVPAQVKSLTKATSRATGATLETDWLGKTIDRKFHRNYGLDGERLTTNDLINILTNRLKYTEQ